MAFMGIFLFFVLIVLAIFAIIGLVGLILVIIAGVRRKKARKNGKKPGKAMLITGLSILGIPVGIALCGALFVVGSNLVTIIERFGYDNFTDRWKNEWVTDSQACDDVVNYFIKSADEKDKEEIMAVFTKEIRQSPDFEAQVDAFLEEYPGGLSDFEFDSKGGQSGTEELNYSYEAWKDDVCYYIHFGAYHQSDDDDPDKIGLAYFYINSEAAEVMAGDYDEEKQFLLADMALPDGYETRRIGGYPEIFKPIDRELTADEVIEAANSVDNISALEALIGEPNCIDTDVQEVIYELVPDGDEKRYAVVDYQGWYGEIIRVNIQGTEDDYFAWLDESGNLVRYDEDGNVVPAD